MTDKHGLWVRAYASLDRHPKVSRARRFFRDAGLELEHDQVLMMFIRSLWFGLERDSREGWMGELEPEDLDLPLRWNGKPGAPFHALVAVGWLELGDRGWRVSGYRGMKPRKKKGPQTPKEKRDRDRDRDREGCELGEQLCKPRGSETNPGGLL